MGVLNLGLAHVATARKDISENSEKDTKNCSTMQSARGIRADAEEKQR